MERILTPVEECRAALRDPSSDILRKYDALFHLMSYGSEEAARVLIESYSLFDSELFWHEIAYNLGQMGQDCAVDFLISVLHDEEEFSVARHEAGEALSNFPKLREYILPHLYQERNSEISILHSTVELAIQKLEKHSSSNNFQKFNQSIEPAEPFSQEQFEEFLAKEKKTPKEILLANDHSELVKYRVMYALRNQQNYENALILAKLLLKQNNDYVSPL